MRFIAFLLAIATLGIDQPIRLRRGIADLAPITVTWTQQSLPGDAPSLMHFTNGVYDSVSGRTMWWLNPTAASSIYASAIHTYTVSGNDWVFVGGSTPSGNSCTSYLGASPSPWPQDRHPVANFMIDPTRNRGVLIDGVCAGDEQDDMWFYALNADPTSNTWTNPIVEDAVALPLYGALVYITDYDLYFTYGQTAGGSGEAHIYAPTASVNANQIAAGAKDPQTWFRTHGPGVGSGLPSFPAMWNNAMFWDTNINRVVLFAKDDDSGDRELWWYDPLTQTWSNRTGTTGVPSDAASLSTGDKDHVLITSGIYSGNYFFHKSTRTSACDGVTAGYIYKPSTEAYTSITTVGTGPGCAVHLAWDEMASKVVGRSGASGSMTVWTGVFSH